MSDEELPPWEQAERNLNASSATGAQMTERSIRVFEPRVLREDAREEDAAAYEAAIALSTVMQMQELQRSDIAKRAQQTGTGDPPSTEPREHVLRLVHSIVESARLACVRPDAAAVNVEMYERLVALRRFHDVADRATLDAIDAIKASGLQ